MPTVLDLQKFFEAVLLMSQLENAPEVEQQFQTDIHQEDAGLQTVGIHIFDAFFAGL